MLHISNNQITTLLISISFILDCSPPSSVSTANASSLPSTCTNAIGLVPPAGQNVSLDATDCSALPTSSFP